MTPGSLFIALCRNALSASQALIQAMWNGTCFPVDGKAKWSSRELRWAAGAALKAAANSVPARSWGLHIEFRYREVIKNGSEEEGRQEEGRQEEGRQEEEVSRFQDLARPQGIGRRCRPIPDR
jgi:hypothetical protein